MQNWYDSVAEDPDGSLERLAQSRNMSISELRNRHRKIAGILGDGNDAGHLSLNELRYAETDYESAPDFVKQHLDTCLYCQSLAKATSFSSVDSGVRKVSDTHGDWDSHPVGGVDTTNVNAASGLFMSSGFKTLLAPIGVVVALAAGYAAGSNDLLMNRSSEALKGYQVVADGSLEDNSIIKTLNIQESASDVEMLRRTFENIPVSSKIGGIIREMATSGEGPFSVDEKTVKLRFVKASDINNNSELAQVKTNIAGICKGDFADESIINVYLPEVGLKSIDPKNRKMIPFNTNAITSLDCDRAEGEPPTVWLQPESFAELFKLDSDRLVEIDDYVNATVTISMLSGVFIPDDIAI